MTLISISWYLLNSALSFSEMPASERNYSQTVKKKGFVTHYCYQDLAAKHKKCWTKLLIHTEFILLLLPLATWGVVLLSKVYQKSCS